MCQDPSTRVIACEFNRRPNLRAIDPAKAIHVRIFHDCIQVSDLPGLFAQFGPVVSLIPTTNGASNIIIFSSETSASRAMQYRFKKPFYIRVGPYFPLWLLNKLPPLNRYSPQGKGGMNGPSGDTSNATVSNPFSHAEIRRDWTLNREDQYIYGTISLDRFLRPLGLQCIENPGCGDCAWYSILEAGKLNSKYPNVRDIRRFVHDFGQRHPGELDHLAHFSQIPLAQQPEWKKQLLHSILTNGTDADSDQIHLAAVALNSQIAVYDVQTHQARFFNSNPPGHGQNLLSIINIAHRRHNVFQGYDSRFQSLGLLHGHYWAIVPIRRRSSRRTRRPLLMSDMVELPIPRQSRQNSSANDEQQMEVADSEVPNDGNNVPIPIPQFLESISQVDYDLAKQLLESVDLPPECVNWNNGFDFLIRHFRPETLFNQRIRTFRFIPGDARPLFRKCYIGVLTVLEALPEFEQSPTVAFLHSQVLSLFTALPALLVSLVTGLGPNGTLDTVKTNCQKFLEANGPIFFMLLVPSRIAQFTLIGSWTVISHSKMILRGFSGMPDS